MMDQYDIHSTFGPPDAGARVGNARGEPTYLVTDQEPRPHATLMPPPTPTGFAMSRMATRVTESAALNAAGGVQSATLEPQVNIRDDDPKARFGGGVSLGDA
jgi:hypothetical protein